MIITPSKGIFTLFIMIDIIHAWATDFYNSGFVIRKCIFNWHFRSDLTLGALMMQYEMIITPSKGIFTLFLMIDIIYTWATDFYNSGFVIRSCIFNWHFRSDLTLGALMLQYEMIIKPSKGIFTLF